MTDRNLEVGKHQGFGWFDPEGFGLLGGIKGGINKDHLGSQGLGSRIYRISPLHQMLT